MSEFVLTPAAEGDIHEILDYIERDNPSAVNRVSEGLRDAMRLIAGASCDRAYASGPRP